MSLNAYCSMALAEAVGAAQAQSDFVVPRFFVADRPAVGRLGMRETMSVYHVGGEAMVLAKSTPGEMVGTTKVAIR